MSITSKKNRNNQGNMNNDFYVPNVTHEVKFSNNSGLERKLPSNIRTEHLKEIALQRGERLRSIREKLNKTLEELTTAFHMNQGNYGRMERGEVCMSRPFAYWISKNLLNYGMVVTSTWLLSGKGPSPQVFVNEPLKLYEYLKNKFEQNQDIITDNSPEAMSEKERDILLIHNMIIYLYNKSYPNSLITYVKDTKMEPSFSKGDLVCGKIVDENNYQELHGKDCIIQSGTHIFVRRVIIVDNDFILKSGDECDIKILNHIDKAAIINFRMCPDISQESNVPITTDINKMMFDICN